MPVVTLYTADGCPLRACARGRRGGACRARVRARARRHRRPTRARSALSRAPSGRRDRRRARVHVLRRRRRAACTAERPRSGSSAGAGRAAGRIVTLCHKPSTGGARGRTPDRRSRRAPEQVPPGPDPGEEDGQGADLVAGDLGVHEHQRDADPARSLGVRQVRQARRRLPHRRAARRDPPDPAHAGPAQHRARRRGPARERDRELSDLRRARDHRRRDLRQRSREDRLSASATSRSARSTTSPRSRASATSSSA